MGIQRVFLTDYVTEASQVLDADVAGITVSVPFSDNLSLTAFWVRPFQLGRWQQPEQFPLFGKNAFRTHNVQNTASWYYGFEGNTDYGLSLSPSAYAFDGRENVYALPRPAGRA